MGLSFVRGIVLVVAVGASVSLDAQRRGGAPQGPPPPPRAAAAIDVTGYWVSLVTDDWRWRVVTPPKGDVLYLPVNAEGRRVADAWDPAKDAAAGEQCRAYGAGGLMHLPGGCTSHGRTIARSSSKRTPGCRRG